MSPSIATEPQPAALPFPSLEALRSVHNELLKTQQAGGANPTLLATAENFIRQGRETGALLDSPADRWSAQSALDYWASILYRIGRREVDSTLADLDPERAPSLADDLCPYVGLEAFRESHHDVFFGRSRLIGEMVGRLTQGRLLAVLGPSGSGKSSLVLGGLLPELKGDALPGSRDWRYIPPLVPGSQPLRNLAKALLPENADPETWISQQAEKLERDPEYLAQILEQEGDRPAVLAIDQFEEIFTLCEDLESRQAFIASLASVLRCPAPMHRVVLTMRSDYEAFVARLEELQPFFDEGQLRVTPLKDAELCEAIERPAESVGLRFEEGLVQALLDDLLGEPAGLPLLQFTLLKLWESRERDRVTWSAYRRLGGARRALAHCADELYTKLIPELQVTAKRILLRMVRPSDGLEVTSNRIRKEALYGSREDPERIDRALDALIGARLVRLTPGEKPDDAQVEVAHEALVRNWPRLVEWLEEVRTGITTRRRLEARAAEWVRLGCGRGGLLDEVELPAAERWLESPEATDLGYDERVVALVRASRRAVNLQSRKRTLARWGIPLLIVLYLLTWTGFAWFVRQRALLKESQATVEGLQRDIGRLEADRDSLKNEKMRLEEDKKKLALGMADVRQRLTLAGERAAKAEGDARQQVLAARQRIKDAEMRVSLAQRDANDAEQEAKERVKKAEEALSEALAKAEEIVQYQDFTAQMRAAKIQRELAALEKETKATQERREWLEKEIADGGGSKADTVPRLLKRTMNTISQMIELAQFRHRLRPVQSGGSTGTDKGLSGSICCVVHDADGTYLLSRASVFDGPSGAPVLQPALNEGPMGRQRDVVATLVRKGDNANRSGAIARIVPGVGVDFAIPRLGNIVGSAARPEIRVGTLVQMAGAGSGIRTGKILRFENDGTIVVDGEPAPGDSGAPVVTMGRQIIGMLWGWSARGREAYVTPIGQVLKELKVELGPQPAVAPAP